MSNKPAPSPAHGGKVDNDTNKAGDHPATQLNQGKRTPQSRSDRESHVGSANQTQERRKSGGTHR